jgi:hypothetical protein
MRYAYKILVGKPDVKLPLGRPRNRWEYNIRMALVEIKCESAYWMHLTKNKDLCRLL